MSLTLHYFFSFLIPLPVSNRNKLTKKKKPGDNPKIISALLMIQEGIQDNFQVAIDLSETQLNTYVEFKLNRMTGSHDRE